MVDVYPIPSMYGIFTYIYHKHQPNVGKYTIHGFYGYVTFWSQFGPLVFNGTSKVYSFHFEKFFRKNVLLMASVFPDPGPGEMSDGVGWVICWG